MIPFRRASARRLCSGHRVYHMGASAGKRRCKSAKASGLPTKNRSARPELQNAFGLTLQKGWGTRKSRFLARRWERRPRTWPTAGAERRWGHPPGSGAAKAQKPQVCRLKTGRPDLSYKMPSDPPFRKGGVPGKADSSPADGRPGMTMGGQVGKARRVATNGISRLGAQVRHFTMLTGLRLMTTSLF